MNLKAMLMEKNPTYNGSTSCLISSQGFLLAAIYQGIVQKNYIIMVSFVWKRTKSRYDNKFVLLYHISSLFMG
jgi:hypothetical protein